MHHDADLTGSGIFPAVCSMEQMRIKVRTPRASHPFARWFSSRAGAVHTLYRETAESTGICVTKIESVTSDIMCILEECLKTNSLIDN